jgi:hypothetical protein
LSKERIPHKYIRTVLICYGEGISIEIPQKHDKRAYEVARDNCDDLGGLVVDGLEVALVFGVGMLALP